LEVEKADLLVEGTVLLAQVLVAVMVLNPVAEALDATELQAWTALGSLQQTEGRKLQMGGLMASVLTVVPAKRACRVRLKWACCLNRVSESTECRLADYIV